MTDDPRDQQTLPWWKVHFPTFVGSTVMAAATIVVATDAVQTGRVGTWITALALAVNAGALLAAARERALALEYEGKERKFARVAELGPHGQREWWWSVVAFIAFAAAIAATLLA